MKRKILLSLLLLILALCIPLLFARPTTTAPGTGDTSAAPDTAETSSPDPGPTPSPEPAVCSDAELRFVALIDGEAYDCCMADYLPGVLAGEMPASFEEEALKAQAIAARTYIIHCMGETNPNHPDADVCDDAGCCKAFLEVEALQERWGENFKAYWEKMCRAVEETDGQYMTYDGEPILAAFHSSSAGRTEDAANLWSARPYLVSVESPESAQDVPNFVTTVEVSAEDFQKTVLAETQGADLSGAPDTWLGECNLEDSGRVDHVTVGGIPISGADLRTMFALRSAAFTLEYTGEHFLFTVTGYGHGVGMSQYGANVMARGGASCQKILEHYYPGVTIENQKVSESAN